MRDDLVPVEARDWEGLVADYRPYENRIMGDLARSGAPTARQECSVIHTMKGLFDARILVPEIDGDPFRGIGT